MVVISVIIIMFFVVIIKDDGYRRMRTNKRRATDVKLEGEKEENNQNIKIKTIQTKIITRYIDRGTKGYTHG